MGKKSKWLKWKIGGSLIVSLAALFQIAKTDPAFGQAVQGVQKNDNAFGIDEDAQGYSPQIQDEAEATKEHNNEEPKNEEPKNEVPKNEVPKNEVPKNQNSQASVETVLAPVVVTTQKTAQTHDEASHSVGTTPARKSVTVQKQLSKNSVPKAVRNSKPAKSEGKQVVSATTATTQSRIQKLPASVDLPVEQQPPADIPIAQPDESTAVTSVEGNSQTEVQTEESNTTQEEAQPSEKKKSQSRSRHS
ncbi:hypothetical protein BBR47_52200 [Brevibacillus brevis NBRC 100599]|uniref:Uncharacterized protein n=1 Tax=Brevibacillus brevis (strain 47 / JCM 6285 / NBRC 100599) TaxID=358681 RepID=C0Z6J8_BREBN|nr:hypothetical protein [Brevibacillus brevis]BAH46197.1 hypothetical protein BBR47_52200 [Brevibacillus brevis NBRC 100599]